MANQADISEEAYQEALRAYAKQKNLAYEQVRKEVEADGGKGELMQKINELKEEQAAKVKERAISNIHKAMLTLERHTETYQELLGENAIMRNQMKLLDHRLERLEKLVEQKGIKR